MKQLILFSALCFFTLSCQQDEPATPAQGELKFSFTKKQLDAGRTQQDEVPAFMLASIKDANNQMAYEDKKIPIYTFGESFVSEALTLKVGSYTLEKFMILSAEGKVLDATPLKNSPLAALVSEALPIAFAITKNGSTLYATGNSGYR
jgi:hypothetical protein